MPPARSERPAASPNRPEPGLSDRSLGDLRKAWAQLDRPPALALSRGVGRRQTPKPSSHGRAPTSRSEPVATKRRNVARCRQPTKSPSDPPPRNVENVGRATALELVVVLAPLSRFGGNMEGGFGEEVESGFSELFGWLEEHGVAPAGAPFIRFLVIDMEGELEIELAVPVADGVSGEGRFRADVLPPGRYGTLLHVGPYDDLVASNAALQEWAEKQGMVWDSWDTDSGSAWRGRVERYLTDPSVEPDPSKWEVEVAYLIAES